MNTHLRRYPALSGPKDRRGGLLTETGGGTGGTVGSILDKLAFQGGIWATLARRAVSTSALLESRTVFFFLERPLGQSRGPHGRTKEFCG